MFHCWLTYRRFYKTAEQKESITEQYHIEEPDEKTIREVGMALSGLMKQLDIDHDVNFRYTPCYLDSPCEYQNPDIKIPRCVTLTEEEYSDLCLRASRTPCYLGSPCEYQNENIEIPQCDNNGDCEHCDWATCPDEEGAEQ